MMRAFKGLQPTAAMLLLLCAGCSKGGEASNSAEQPAKAAPVSFDTSLPVKTVMEHIITPAAFGVWGASGYELTEKGERDLAPRTDAEWEQVVNHAATL